MERRQAPPQIAHHGALAAIAVVGGVVAGLVGRVGGLLGSALRDGRQSGARPNAMRSNAGHSYGIGNIVADAVTYALQSSQGLQ